MHRRRSAVALAVALGLAGCDPLVRATLDVVPPRPAGPGSPSTAAPDSTAASGLAALARVAQGFALQSTTPAGADCPRRWQGRVSTAGAQFFVMCARPLPSGGLRVVVSEVLTKHWSPRGDSLRRAAADTLARLGPVTIQAGS